MINFICMGPIDLPGAPRKRQNTKWKILSYSGTRTHNFEFSSQLRYRLSYPRFDEAWPIKVNFIRTFTSDTNVYIGLSSRMMK